MKPTETLHSTTSPAKIPHKTQTQFPGFNKNLKIKILKIKYKKNPWKEKYLFDLKRIETDCEPRFRLCSKKQRSIQERTEITNKTEYEEEEIQSFNGAPIKAKSNSADINPLTQPFFSVAHTQ